jgi:LPXTG-motif cell wall-anchored protein
MGEGVVATGAITKDVINNTGTVLPETGAKGTVMLISFSSLFVVMAAVFMITRKKMSVYED